MNITIVGHGKMGKAIERKALSDNHSIIGIVTSTTPLSTRRDWYRASDLAIEFSSPESAFENLKEIVECGTSVVTGTTGWLDRYDEIVNLVHKKKTGFLYASNFSIGVNIFFALNRKLASIMNNFDDFEPSIHEIHHVHKKDAPSGTAISIAKDLIKHVDTKSSWSMDANDASSLHIKSTREGEVFGIHEVKYLSKVDQITIAHEARSREGFVEGALFAAKWMIDRVGVYSMEDILGL